LELTNMRGTTATAWPVNATHHHSVDGALAAVMKPSTTKKYAAGYPAPLHRRFNSCP